MNSRPTSLSPKMRTRLAHMLKDLDRGGLQPAPRIYWHACNAFVKSSQRRRVGVGQLLYVKVLTSRSNTMHAIVRWEFPKIRGTVLWGPYDKDPTTILRGSPIFRNSQIVGHSRSRGKRRLLGGFASSRGHARMFTTFSLLLKIENTLFFVGSYYIGTLPKGRVW